MHINKLDLNLLRLFDAVYRARSVSVAAQALEMTQPAASHGLRRLRMLIGDPLFVRVWGGVQPTRRAERLAEAVRIALGTVEAALEESVAFDPRQSVRTFRLHLSDVGEARFLPDLIAALSERAPGVRLETYPIPRHEIVAGLDDGRIDLALGFLPMVMDTQRLQLLKDHYVVVLRKDHPFIRRRLQGAALLKGLSQLEFVAARTHAETLRILQLTRLDSRLRLVIEHFMVLPSIVKASDLAAIVPREIAQSFGSGYSILEPDFPRRGFSVSLHWSRRYEGDPGLKWLRNLLEELFRI